jgi:hypothetical protein
MLSGARSATMTKSLIRQEVELMLSDVDADLAKAETRRAKGGLKRVEAAGELADLKRQKAALVGRLKEIDADPDANDTFFRWVKEDLFNLKLRLANWIATV